MEVIDIVKGPDAVTIAAHLRGLNIDQNRAKTLAEMLVSPNMARPVTNSYANNTRVRFPSLKMRAAVICESYSLEYGYSAKMEFDADVLWFASQPCTMQLALTYANGRVCPHDITPDFLVVTRDEVFFVETKPEEVIAKKAGRSPDWQRSDSGWRYLPGEKNPYGIGYKVVTESDVSRHAIQNYETLRAAYLKAKPIDANELGRLNAVLADQREATIKRLQEEFKFQLPFIRQALISGVVSWLPDTDLITEPHRCRLFSDGARAAVARDAKPVEGVRAHVGDIVMLQDTPWVVMGLGRGKVFLVNKASNMTQEIQLSSLPRDAVQATQQRRTTLSEYPDKDVQEAYRRVQLIRAWSKSGPPTSQKSSYYRWKAAFEAREKEDGQGFVALIPNRNNQGARGTVHPEHVLRLMDRMLKKYYLTKVAPSLVATYDLLKVVMAARARYRDLMVPCYETLRRRLKLIPVSEQTRARQGKRMANAIAPTLAQSEGELPVRGLFPWHVVECDHTLCDLQLYDQNGQPLTGQTWLTVMVDSFSRMPLAWRLTVKSADKAEPRLEKHKNSAKDDRPATPSAMRMASLLRELACLYGQWPIRLHLDNGSDFRSGVVERALAAYGVTVSNRSPGNPRRGPVIESFIRCINEGLFHRLPGNKKMNKHHRSVTKSSSPLTHGKYTLEEANDMLDEWMINVFPLSEHTGVQRKPEDLYREGMALVTEVITVLYDDRLRFELSPEVGSFKIVPGKGIHHHVDYWADCFDMPCWRGRRVPVRKDVWDESFVWVNLGKQWVEARSQTYASMQKLNEPERRIRSEEAHFARIASRRRKREGDLAILPEEPSSPGQRAQAAAARSADDATPSATPPKGPDLDVRALFSGAA